MEWTSMETNILHEKDSFGILPSGEEIPYVSFKLTHEQMEAIKSKKAIVYETNGQKFFKIRGENGVFTEEYIMFIMFVD